MACRRGIPAGSRATLASYAFLREGLTDPVRNRIVDELEAIARDLGCTLAALAIAWCLKQAKVSSVILGATRLAQLTENLKAVDVVAKLTPEVLQRIDSAVGAHTD